MKQLQLKTGMGGQELGVLAFLTAPFWGLTLIILLAL
jgi:hypothetical protein